MDYLAISTDLSGLALSITLALIAVVMGLSLLLEAVRCFQANRTEAMRAFCADMDTVENFRVEHAESISQGRSLFQEPTGLLEHLCEQDEVVTSVTVEKIAETKTEMSWYSMEEFFVSALQRVDALEFRRIEALR